jgi:hypothetical protein
MMIRERSNNSKRHGAESQGDPLGRQRPVLLRHADRGLGRDPALKVWNRASRILRLGACLVLPAFLGVAILACLIGTPVLGQNRDDSGRTTPVQLAPSSSPQFGPEGAPQPQVQRGACTDNEECNDGIPCTSDLCIDDACVNETIPGCVPCELNYICPAIEIVFVMDTSGSMRDEATALCEGIGDVVADLQNDGVQITAHVLGITELGIGDAFACLSDTVVDLLGPQVPGELAFCPFPNQGSSFEAWGPATSIVADRFPWTPGAIRMVVPLSDEGACNGSRPGGCSRFGEDLDAVDNATLVAFEANVIASMITGTGSDTCVRELAEILADATGGITVHLKDANKVPQALREVIFHVCTPDPACDDLDACTDDDVCVDGVCRGQPNYDVATECCRPEDRFITPLDDGNDCTLNVCDPLTGEVTHPPAPEGVTCDDGDACTALDICDGDGGCFGEDINTFDCESDEDCFGAICDQETGTCFCTHTPELCLEMEPGTLPDDTCYTVGDEIIVRVVLGFSTRTIVGGDFLIEYDPVALEFIDILPGTEVDPLSPFGLELFRQIDEITGRIAYSAGVDQAGQGSQGPATMAAIKFMAKTACTTDELCFLDGNPFTTKLSGAEGQPVEFTRCCTGQFKINGPAPAFTCPSSVSLNANAGTTTNTVVWDPVTVLSECQPDLPFTCTANHSSGTNIDHLLAGGGLFPTGLSTFQCSATDACGASGSCEWTVEVRRFNTFEVSVELSPSMADDPKNQPLQRCVEFEFFANCVQQPIVVQQTMSFGLPFNLPGHADDVVLKVPAGQYACVTARDPLHTLRSSSSLQKVNGRYVASFQGDPFFGGNWLVGGNLDGSTVIDIIDFGLLIDKYLQRLDPHTPCGSTGPHADINGDGLVDALDLSFVSLNFLATDKNMCCPEALTSSGPAPISSVTLSELRDAGIRNPSRLDANRDGVFDMTDIRMLLSGQRPQAPPRGLQRRSSR